MSMHILFLIRFRSTFEAALVFLPILAVLVGFIPGCGPQVLVTTLYLNGIIPFAALIGNAISNDGDAYFLNSLDPKNGSNCNTL